MLIQFYQFYKIVTGLLQADGPSSNSYTDDRKSACHQYFWSELHRKYISFLHSWHRLQKGNQSERRWDCVLKFFPLEVRHSCSKLIAGFISDVAGDSTSLTTLSFSNLLIYKWGLSPLLNELKKDWRLEKPDTTTNPCCFSCEKRKI